MISLVSRLPSLKVVDLLTQESKVERFAVRKQPPEPKEATIAPVIAKSWSRNQSCQQDGKDLCTTWPKNPEERVADQAEKVATQPEYDLLGHLSKLAAHISILELLRTSPKHKEKAVQKAVQELFFNFNQEAQVPATLTPEELQDVVWSNRLRPNMRWPLQKSTYQRGGIHHNKWSVVRCLIISCRTICFVALGLTSNLGFGMDSLSERSRANPLPHMPFG